MIRLVIENVLLFFAPALIYVGYIWLKRSGESEPRGLLDEAPIVWLAASGAVLVVVAMVLFGSTYGGRPDQGYEPPEMKGSKIVPGHRQ